MEWMVEGREREREGGSVQEPGGGGGGGRRREWQCRQQRQQEWKCGRRKKGRDHFPNGRGDTIFLSEMGFVSEAPCVSSTGTY